MELSLKNQHIKSTDFLRLDYILYNKTRKKKKEQLEETNIWLHKGKLRTNVS